ncbi:MAG: hypothetical protein IPJ81_06605 [Chitinophagaceae bacterium]|nr:hypothetical protein [Chitinophagaceae bacterium]
MEQKNNNEPQPIETTPAAIAANPMLAAGVVLFDGKKVIIQEANYIEHGWYIEIIHNEITLWEIPYGGGEPIRISDFLTVAGAIHAAGRLT